MGSRITLFAAAIALVCVSVTPTHAASDTAPVEVARAGDDALRAGDEDGQVCISTIPQDAASSCAETDAGVAMLAGALVGAALPLAAASIEVHRLGAVLARGPTVAGEAYRGVRGGTLRFALLRLPEAVDPAGVRVRAVDAAGALVAVLAPDDSEIVSDRRRLLSGRSGGARWSLVTEQQSVLSASVLDLGRESVSRCLNTTVRRADVTVEAERCVGGFPQDPLELLEQKESDAIESCPRFRLVHGVVSGAVSRVSVLLGDGRRRAAATVAVGDGRRAYALPTGAGAVRSVRLITPGGRDRVLRERLAPLAVQCAGGPGFDLGSTGPAHFDELPMVSPAGPATTITGPPAARVADGPAGALCLAVGDNAFRLAGCGIVSPWLGELLGALDSYVDPKAFVLAVPARVAAIRIAGADGTTRTLATVTGDGYAGPHAGVVRFVTGALGDISELRSIDLLDSAGGLLFGEAQIDNLLGIELSALRFGDPRRVAGRAGRPSLWRTTGRLGSRSASCLALTSGAAPARDERCAASGETVVLLDASCATHRLTVAVGARSGMRVVADLGGSERRRVRLRRGTGLLTLPASKPLRALTFTRGGRTRRVRVDAPPARRQCGWRAVPDIA